MITKNSPTSNVIADYIHLHPHAVIGTINDDGTPHGAVLYVDTAGVPETIYFLTKTNTKKYKNIVARPQVSVTIVDTTEMSTLQASGEASIVNDSAIIDRAMKSITRAHSRSSGWLPPIAQLHAGNYVLIGVRLTSARLAKFERDAGDAAPVFIEL